MGTLIGTIRMLPLNQGLAPCDAFLDRQPDLPAGMRDHSWEVGRLVLAPRYRAGPELLRRCLALTLLHMVDQVPVENIFASCKPALARLYRRFGYSVVVKDVGGGAGGEPYSLIHGCTPVVMRAVCDRMPQGAGALQ
ncbi:MAG TPA: N-acetyltransferase [Ramlibacter sp.]|jgi:predicted GNAT family N-acyltransferase|uniref:N-acetyltransferase n=1 Tax=Ramlibacter sp. TaxID=1917967 RepID=UPI002D60820F|nr:N-acetyltransferase [Ramlibacter sp.]HZY18525.1 N-acetyltransferase [Ramlibacter sp.]